MNNQLPLTVFGISHRTAPVEVREKVALSEEEQKKALRYLTNDLGNRGCLLLSTCNRTEVYLSTDKPEEKSEKAREWLNELKQCTEFTDQAITYSLNGVEAAKHYFKVISGVDSQIVGEQQIVGQVKDSYDMAHALEATDAVINKLFNFAMQAKKKVHNDTFLSDGTVSVSFAGVELARKIFSNLSEKNILLVGAGKTAELAAWHFLENGVQSINVVNRTYERAVELAEKLMGEAYMMDELAKVLTASDIVISATASEEYVIDKNVMAPAAKKRHHRPIFLIDLAIPRDIDPAINEIDGVFLYNLDDLHEIVETNLEKRRKEIPKALRIINEYVAELEQWYSMNSINAVIGKLKRRLDTIRLNELERLKSKLPENGYETEINYLTESIINKVVRQYVKSLKNNIHDPELYRKQVELIFSIYELDKEK